MYYDNQPGGYVSQEIRPGTNIIVPVSRSFVQGYLAGAIVGELFGSVRQVLRDAAEARRIRRWRAR
jgi:hypothetical protein